MAEQYTIFSSTLTSIADAIREKRGNTTEVWLPSEMPSAILGIEGEGANDDLSIWAMGRLSSVTDTGGKVTELLPCAFQAQCEYLSYVEMPFCSYIGEYAFALCSALQHVWFPVCGIIGDGAFAPYDLSQRHYGSCGLLEASFPACVIIGNNAFFSCQSLSAVSFPVCVSIGAGAFGSCSMLSVVDFPACSYVGAGAFADCDGLVSISFRECSEVGDEAFYRCSSLSEVELPACETLGTGAFETCGGLMTASFPECRAVGDLAFANCSNLLSVYFMGSVAAELGGSYVFNQTPMEWSSYFGYYGSVYVPASLYEIYISLSYWSSISSRIVGI